MTQPPTARPMGRTTAAAARQLAGQPRRPTRDGNRTTPRRAGTVRPRRATSWRTIGHAATAALVCLTTPITAAASPPAVPRSGDMILPLAQVQSIVGEPTLEPKPYDDRTSPRVDHSLDTKLTAPCRHFMNQDELFGDTWLNFASVGYGGQSNLGVRQNIAVYLDAGTARRSFDALKTAARQCRTQYPTDIFGSGYYTLAELDPVTLQVQYPDSVNGPGSVSMYALRGQVLIEVGAPHLSTDPRIAQTVLALISKKIS